MKEQPAIKNYFFGKAYSDLKNTISESFTQNTDKARDFFDKAGYASLPSYYWGMGIATYCFWDCCVFGLQRISHCLFIDSGCCHLHFVFVDLVIGLGLSKMAKDIYRLSSSGLLHQKHFACLSLS